MIAYIPFINYFRQTILNAVSIKQINFNISNDIETGISDDWDFIQKCPFTEPVWGKVLNK